MKIEIKADKAYVKIGFDYFPVDCVYIDDGGDLIFELTNEAIEDLKENAKEGLI